MSRLLPNRYAVRPGDDAETPKLFHLAVAISDLPKDRPRVLADLAAGAGEAGRVAQLGDQALAVDAAEGERVGRQRQGVGERAGVVVDELGVVALVGADAGDAARGEHRLPFSRRACAEGLGE